MAVYVIIGHFCGPAGRKGRLRSIRSRRFGRSSSNMAGATLARGGKITPVAGDWKPERIILIEFPSSDHVGQWWSSPEYKAIAGLRGNATLAKAIIVEGCNAETSDQTNE